MCLSCAVMKPWLFKSRLYSAALLCFPSPMPRAWRSPRLGPLLSSSRKISLSRSPQPGTMVKVHDVHTCATLKKNRVFFVIPLDPLIFFLYKEFVFCLAFIS